MCTAITFRKQDLYFGRTLDHTCSYGEEIVITPRNFPLSFRSGETLVHHYAMIGVAHVENRYPLYYDGMNEAGLAMAGLNLVGFTHYSDPLPGAENIAHFELIPLLLGRCATAAEAKELLRSIHITNLPFSPTLAPAQLHWILADRQEAITVEVLEDGLHISENPVGVLTNAPPFPMQMLHLSHYMHLSPDPPANRFAPGLHLAPHSRGMGAMGLPGDLSSPSRFVRAAFTKENALCGDTEEDAVSCFFHIMDTVAQTKGCCETEDGDQEITRYTSCCNASKGIYYYTTYGRKRISSVTLSHGDPEGNALRCFPLLDGEDIFPQN